MFVIPKPDAVPSFATYIQCPRSDVAYLVVEVPLLDVVAEIGECRLPCLICIVHKKLGRLPLLLEDAGVVLVCLRVMLQIVNQVDGMEFGGTSILSALR